jgi:hypothetical protein
MRKNKKTQLVTRVGAVLAIFAQVMMFSAAPAQAGLFGGGGSISLPSPSKVAGELERRYNINLQSVQNQAQNFNVSDTKKLSPEVSLYFSPTDPRPGEKVQARAFPIYFTNPDDALYYTWYLKRDGCELDRGNLALCDHDGSGTVTVNDWKIEAMRYVTQNGFVVQNNTYTRGDNDNDGYRAPVGGDNMAGAPNYCYVNDPANGMNYELTGGGNSGFSCSAGLVPVCMDSVDLINPLPVDPLLSSSGFDVTDGTVLDVVGFPTCSGVTPSCVTGVPCCAASTDATSCAQVLALCSSSGVSSGCRHYFADPPGRTNGDGSYGLQEEQFWQSDPNDPSTAQNSKKDEANTAGLGAQTFTWNYLPGDRVGVLVEGTSLVQTKHDDSSMMIMWALPRNQCHPRLVGASTGSYVQNIRGYAVDIPTTSMNINDCIEHNLIDPTEGGQPISSGLDVSVIATPENPVNDETTDLAGDTIFAQATLENSTRENATILYDWSVHLTNSPIALASQANNVTDRLRELGLISDTSGNALERIDLTLNIPRSTIISGNSTLGAYLTDGAGYLRFVVNVQEIVDGVVLRRGRSDVLVKFISTGRKIAAYTVTPIDAAGSMHVRTDALICNVTPLERNSCRVIKNEIVGLRLDPTGLTNFNWTVNGTPLICSAGAVSPQCSDGVQNEYNFFPVTGNVGEAYTISVSAADTTSGRSVMLARTFHVVEPFVEIASADEARLTPVFLGYYRDVLGTTDPAVCVDGLCPNYAKDAYTAVAGTSATATVAYVPSWLGTRAQSYWALNDMRAPVDNVAQLTFPVSSIPGTIDRLEFVAMVQETDDIRKALFDIWKISPLDSPEYHFAKAVNITATTGDTALNDSGPRKYLALISSYVPATLLFTLRILLSGFVILFVLGVLFSFYPEKKRRSLTIG